MDGVVNGNLDTESPNKQKFELLSKWKRLLLLHTYTDTETHRHVKVGTFVQLLSNKKLVLYFECNRK